jgi:putative transposase
MGTHQKKARRREAHLAIIDESGLLMTPLVRRTWAPRGQTPVLVQRSGRREKVSVAAAVCLSPQRKHLGLFFRTLINDYFDNDTSAAFVEMLVRKLQGPVVAVWDGGTMHKGDPIEELLERLGPRLSLERLPPYAPELSPVEPLWSWLKYSRLNNVAPQDAYQLNEAVIAELSAIRGDQHLLKGFFHASQLPLPRALLS